MTTEEFRYIASELRGTVEYLYFHVMGEPLLHPRLGEFLSIAWEMGFQVILTTNGTLLNRHSELLCAAGALKKVSISLHSFEANAGNRLLEEYLTDCFTFCKKAAEKGIICVMRLWNQGGEEDLNPMILERMHSFFDPMENTEWKSTYSGFRIRDKIFLE